MADTESLGDAGVRLLENSQPPPEGQNRCESDITIARTTLRKGHARQTQAMLDLEGAPSTPSSGSG